MSNTHKQVKAMTAVVAANFRYTLSASAVVTEQLADGICNFVADAAQLERLVSSR